MYRNWLFRLAWGVTSGAGLVLSVAQLAGLAALSSAQPAFAQEPVRIHRDAEPPPAPPQEPTDADEPAGVQVLTRGPVHEAFAEPITLDPEPGLLVREAPPPALDEVPPDQFPVMGTSGADLANAEWIPGYWAWDDQRRDYIWVSGVWRVPPPDATWVPGHWADTGDGYRWTAGFWLPDDDDEIDYLPTPPDNLDEGPTGASPGPEYVWVPGAWYSEEDYEPPAHLREIVHRAGFFWRPGYWLHARVDWTWMPARYIWTARGDIFVEGHWDHELDDRGLLFAPIVVDADVLEHGHFEYVPQIVINPDLLMEHLFMRPRYVHYYFGDFYAARYARRGIYPWFETQRVGYDPIFVMQTWRHRDDAHWLEKLHSDYEHRRTVVTARPPDTFRALVERLHSTPVAERRTIVIAQPLRQVQTETRHITLRPVDQARKTVIAQQTRAIRDLRHERANWEVPTARAGTPTGAIHVTPQPGAEPPNRQPKPEPAEPMARPQATPPQPRPVQPVPAQPTPPAHPVQPTPPAHPQAPAAPAHPPAQPTPPVHPEAQPAQPRKVTRTPAQPPLRVKLPQSPITGKTPEAHAAQPPKPETPQNQPVTPRKIQRQPTKPAEPPKPAPAKPAEPAKPAAPAKPATPPPTPQTRPAR